MQKKVSKEIGFRPIVELPLPNEALNPRKRGGQAVPDFKPTNEVIEHDAGGRPCTGELSKYPYEVTREGVERR